MTDVQGTHGKWQGPNGDRTTERWTGGMANRLEMRLCQRKSADTSVSINPRLLTQGWVSDKPCLVTVATGRYVTVSRSDIAIDGPQDSRTNVTRCRRYLRKPTTSWRKFSWHCPQGSTHLKYGYSSPISQTGSSWGWASCAHMMHLWIYGVKCCVLQKKRYRYGAPTFQPGSGQWSGDTWTMRGSGDGSIEKPLEVENGLVEPSPEAHLPKSLYVARTPVRDRQEVPMRVMKLPITRRSQEDPNLSTLWASQATDPIQYWTTDPRHYP
jgi:hypothetical protein